jgi:hypothetical protein
VTLIIHRGCISENQCTSYTCKTGNALNTVKLDGRVREIAHATHGSCTAAPTMDTDRAQVLLGANIKIKGKAVSVLN